MQESLDQYRGLFKAAVLEHLLEVMDELEWERLRSLSLDSSRFFLEGPALEQFQHLVNASAEVLVEETVAEAGLSVDETMSSSYRAKAVVIATIAGQPVFYISGEGVYLWGLEPKDGFSLSFWLTFPAYPPGW